MQVANSDSGARPHLSTSHTSDSAAGANSTNANILRSPAFAIFSQQANGLQYPPLHRIPHEIHDAAADFALNDPSGGATASTFAPDLSSVQSEAPADRASSSSFIQSVPQSHNNWVRFVPNAYMPTHVQQVVPWNYGLVRQETLANGPFILGQRSVPAAVNLRTALPAGVMLVQPPAMATDARWLLSSGVGPAWIQGNNPEAMNRAIADRSTTNAAPLLTSAPSDTAGPQQTPVLHAREQDASGVVVATRLKSSGYHFDLLTKTSSAQSGHSSPNSSAPQPATHEKRSSQSLEPPASFSLSSPHCIDDSHKLSPVHRSQHMPSSVSFVPQVFNDVASPSGSLKMRTETVAQHMSSSSSTGHAIPVNCMLVFFT